MKDFDFQKELEKLPKNPGVYIMRDKNDTIIYVGKAVNLHNRVRSYFRENIGRGPKIDMMVKLIDYFEYIITDSELEALVLENNLIKEHRPKYNTMLMDDKTYPYIKVTVNEEYPRVIFSRKMEKDKAKYFGPYTSAASVKEALDLINKLYCLRTCNKKIKFGEKAEERPCLNYHMGMCCAPCQGNISREDYAERVKKALDFLGGDYAPIQRELREKMQRASDNMEFEEAIKYRDLLESVVSVSQKQKIEDSAQEDKDIIAAAVEGEDAVVNVFFVRNGRMTGREHYYMSLGAEENDIKDILSNFLMQFYGGTPYIPREIMIPCELDDENDNENGRDNKSKTAMIEDWLTGQKGSRVYLKIPKIGQKEKLMELAENNAKLILSKDKEKIKLEEARTTGAVKEIERLLGIPSIERMEAFDISNTSGFANVASMVVFEKGKPKKSDYRKFKIKTVAGPDDYECMREALTRRFSHGLSERDTVKEDEQGSGYVKFAKFPDLLLMDGGKGQVGVALEVLEDLGLDIPVCGMVKDDHHRTRGLLFNNEELPIDTHGEAFKLITRVQDEAHRFAIEYHRSLRTKNQVHSVLDEIPGVGPSRRMALMKAYSSIDELKEATEEELMERAGLPVNAAKAVYEFFHKEKNTDK
ncbi:MAG: excinuclease ABC subunit UvrC [Lachnospiraceae bacterium]|nr:excinuclease ABC subunit UvrC [Lachnospiraceae bacterium]